MKVWPDLPRSEYGPVAARIVTVTDQFHEWWDIDPWHLIIFSSVTVFRDVRLIFVQRIMAFVTYLNERKAEDISRTFFHNVKLQYICTVDKE
jgi:hypothetical protein